MCNSAAQIQNKKFQNWAPIPELTKSSAQSQIWICVYDLVPEGAHARGYALQFKTSLKTFFIWNVVYLHEWMNI